MMPVDGAVKATGALPGPFARILAIRGVQPDLGE
jgi:hypothetical protein